MLGRIAQQPLMPCEAPRPLHSEDKWQRNEMEDMKRAIELLYEFREKLFKLHPVAFEAIDQMLQRPRY
jgi:hypothetical protein